MSVILEVKDLHVRYGKVEALHGANLKVGAGQIVTVIGPNGAGKSTMLGAIMGALPTTGSANGVVSYLGHNLTGLPVEKRVARGMCLVPEKRELFATMSVEDNLVLGAYRRKRAGERSYLDQMEVVYDLFSATERASRAGSRHALGRRAPDARRGPRVDGQAPVTDAG